MDSLSSFLLFTAVFDIFLGIAVLIHGTRKTSEIFFSFFTGAIAFWIFCIVALRLANTFDTALLALAGTYIAGTAIAGSFSFFTHAFTRHFMPYARKFLVVAGALVTIFFAFFSPDFIQNITNLASPNKVLHLGELHWIFLVYFFVVMGHGLYLLCLNIFEIQNSGERTSNTLLFLGIGSAALIGGMSNIIFVAMGNAEYISYGPIAINIMAGCIAYAIMKHSFMRMRVIGAEFFTAALVLILFMRLFFSEGYAEAGLNAFLLISAIGFGVLLIRSVLKEVRDKEHIADLARQLEENNEELKKLDKAKSEFISIASHQLRAPLTIIKGYVSMARDGTFGPINDQLRESLGRVFLSAEQLVRLVASLLDLSRIESGKMQYDFAPSRFTLMVEEIIRSFDVSAKQHGVNLSFENDAGDVEVVCDVNAMREVVTNLIDNAIKYSVKGDKSVRVWQSLETRGGALMLRLSVRDNGIGIASEDVERLFQKFVRTEIARSTDPNGMGIGLYYVKRVVEEHGGRTWVESEGVDKGSVFGFEIPVTRV